MTISVYNFIEQLSAGETSNLNLSEEGSETIKDSKWPQVLGAVNDVMTRLYTRFTIREGLVRIQLMRDNNRYLLDPKNALSNATEYPDEDHYIVDSEDDPFTGSVGQVLGCFDWEGGIVPLNSAGGWRGIRSSKDVTTDQTVINLTYPDFTWYRGGGLDVTYRKKFDLIPVKRADITEETMLILPQELYAALKAGVAAEIYDAMVSQDASVQAAKQRQKFEALCSEVTLMDSLGETQAPEYDKFHRNGFV